MLSGMEVENAVITLLNEKYYESKSEQKMI